MRVPHSHQHILLSRKYSQQDNNYGMPLHGRPPGQVGYTFECHVELQHALQMHHSRWHHVATDLPHPLGQP